MKRCREAEPVHDKRSSGSRHSSSSSNVKEETTSSSSCRISGNRGNRTEHKEDHCNRNKRERSGERSSGGRPRGNGRSGGHGSSPSRGDRNRNRKDTGVHERDKRRSRSSSVDKYRPNRRTSRSKSRERRSSKDTSNTKKLPERRRSRSPRGSSKDKQTKRYKSGERSGRRSRSPSGSSSSSPKHGSSNIVVTGPDSKELTVHIPEPVKKSGGRESFGSLPTNNSIMSTGRLTTPQMALQQAMAAMNAKAQQMTGVKLPTYYNPTAVNPLKYAEQMQKRRLLWQKKKEIETVTSASNNNWEETSFAQDQDGRVAAKFKRLMGIKSDEVAPALPVQSNTGGHLKKQEELFKSLDQQYEQARQSTHTHRGVGLGYSSISSISSVPSYNMFPK